MGQTKHEFYHFTFHFEESMNANNLETLANFIQKLLLVTKKTASLLGKVTLLPILSINGGIFVEAKCGAECISHFLKVYFPVLASKFQPSCFYPPPCDSSLEWYQLAHGHLENRTDKKKKTPNVIKNCKRHEIKHASPPPKKNPSKI